MIRMILDIATMRVIYFTNDVNESLTVVEKTLMYDYLGELPTDFKLSNCWNWKLEGNKLQFSNDKKSKESQSLFEKNKIETIKLLNDRINQARMPFLSNCVGGDRVRDLKLNNDEFLYRLANIHGLTIDEYRIVLMEKQQTADRILQATEINKEYFYKKINEALDNWTLYSVREEFANIDLTLSDVV